jgi:hypothetical protein
MAGEGVRALVLGGQGLAAGGHKFIAERDRRIGVNVGEQIRMIAD